MDRLDTRREALCLKFARNAIKNPKFKSWFAEDTKVQETRRLKKNLKTVYTRTKRFQESTIPYLTELLTLRGFLADSDETNI